MNQTVFYYVKNVFSDCVGKAVKIHKKAREYIAYQKILDGELREFKELDEIGIHHPRVLKSKRVRFIVYEILTELTAWARIYNQTHFVAI